VNLDPPALAGAGEKQGGTAKLLIFSQVILSMQLPFAVIPLVQCVSDRKKMGAFAISRPLAVVSWTVAAIILILNIKLLADTALGTS
jgi:manganese transport protein